MPQPLRSRGDRYVSGGTARTSKAASVEYGDFVYSFELVEHKAEVSSDLRKALTVKPAYVSRKTILHTHGPLRLIHDNIDVGTPFKRNRTRHLIRTYPLRGEMGHRHWCDSEHLQRQQSDLH